MLTGGLHWSTKVGPVGDIYNIIWYNIGTLEKSWLKLAKTIGAVWVWVCAPSQCLHRWYFDRLWHHCLPGSVHWCLPKGGLRWMAPETVGFEDPSQQGVQPVEPWQDPEKKGIVSCRVKDEKRIKQLRWHRWPSSQRFLRFKVHFLALAIQQKYQKWCVVSNIIRTSNWVDTVHFLSTRRRGNFPASSLMCLNCVLNWMPERFCQYWGRVSAMKWRSGSGSLITCRTMPCPLTMRSSWTTLGVGHWWLIHRCRPTSGPRRAIQTLRPRVQNVKCTQVASSSFME